MFVSHSKKFEVTFYDFEIKVVFSVSLFLVKIYFRFRFRILLKNLKVIPTNSFSTQLAFRKANIIVNT